MLIQLKIMEHDDMDAGYESLPVHDTRILTKVECIGVERRTKPSKHHVYVLVVCWSDGVKYPIYRRYISFFDLKICIKEELKGHPNCKEPELPALKHFERGWRFGSKETAMDKRKKYINTFCEHVLKLPEDVLRSNSVESFYDAWESDYDQHNQNPRHSQGKSPVPARKYSAPTLAVPFGLKLEAPSNGDIKFGKYQDRTIPDLEEKPRRRARATSMVVNSDYWPTNGNPADSALSLPRGINLMTLPDEPLGLPYRANCDYEKRRLGEINLQNGQLVEVLEKSLSGWWFVHVEGQDGQTEQGWAPGAFLDQVARSPKLLKSTSLGTEPIHHDDLCGVYETICDFRALEEDEVSYTQGQKVEVISTEPDGWWKVRTEDEKEGYTPAMNLKSMDKRAKPAEEESLFRKRSLRGRGPPPRRSVKASEGPNIETQPNAEKGSEVPLYSEIRKPDLSSTLGSVQRDRGHVVTEEKELNYTEVIFPTKRDDSLWKPDSPRIRRQPRVEYAEINPRPLPSMPGNSNKAHSTVHEHTYDNVSAQYLQQQQQHNQKPRPLYENIGSDDFMQPALSANPGENAAKHHHHLYHHHPRSDPDPSLVETDTSAHQRQISSPGSSSPGQTQQTQERARICPVPKPRKPQRAQAVIIRNYEKPAETAGKKLAATRPQEPLPVQHRHQEPTPKAYNVVDQKLPRYKYENTAVGIVNNLIQSHSVPPRDSNRITKNSEAGYAHPSIASTIYNQGGGNTLGTVHGPQKEKMADQFIANLTNMNPVLTDYMVHLPPPPAIQAPSLPPEAAIWWSKIPELGESNMVEAIWDYDAPSGVPGIMSFKKSDVGVKVSCERNGWLGVKIGERIGWVPILYWGTYVPNPSSSRRAIKNIKQAEVLHENKAWFLGKMTRQEAEDLLVHHGSHREFLVRESTNRVGDLTLSVKDKDRIRHFPIQMTASGKYDIGKAHFTDLTKVVAYYQTNPLFFDDQKNNEPVSLGKPINRPKSP